MSFVVVIPARYASQRLPGKPLLEIGGRMMIERVYHCAKKSKASRIVVATDDHRIFDFVKTFGGEVVMTAEGHNSGTDRLQEVVSILGFDRKEIVVNVQGDEPLIPAAVINQVAENLAKNRDASAATLCEDITDIETIFDPNAVKVVVDDLGNALYFSRASIPWSRDTYLDDSLEISDLVATRRHIGIYAYRVELLNRFVTWSESPLEKVEKLEQLRILSHGEKIHVATACENVPGGVDTPEDLQRVRDFFVNEGLV